MGPSSQTGAAERRAGVAGLVGGRSFVRPCGSDGDELTCSSGLRQPVGTRRFDRFSSARGRSVRQPSVQRVSQSDAGNEQTELGRVGCRTERPSSRRQTFNHHGDKPRACRGSVHRCGLATRVQRVVGESGATTRRARQAPCPDDRTPGRGQADLPYLQYPFCGPPCDRGSRLPDHPGTSTGHRWARAPTGTATRRIRPRGRRTYQQPTRRSR